jgi:hypothetical protein
LELGAREIKAIPEILASLALLPCVQVNLQLAVSLTRPHGVDADLKHLPDHRISEAKLFQVRVNSAKTSLHSSPVFIR